MSKGTFSPVMISDCNSPSQELLKVALAKDVDEKLLEARLKGVYYLVSLKGKPPRELIPEELPFLDDEGFLLQNDLVIEQRYSIIIDLAPSYNYQFSLTLSADGRELYFRMAQGSKVDKSPKGIKKLFERVRIQKADMHVLIRDEKSEYERLVAFIGSLPDEKFLSQSHEFLLMRSVGGVPCVEPHLEEVVQRKTKAKYVLIAKDQLIAIFHKGQTGEAARDCLGRFIAPKEPTQSNVSPLVADASIDIQEDDRTVKYYAKDAGYILFEKDTISITQKLSLKNVSVTTTGNLLGGLNTNTHISIHSVNMMEDAVGEGVVIEAGTVEVIGNVGNKAIIRANKVIIKGQTHQNSQILADVADVAIHKGLVVADSVHVARLEAGIVKGENVKIDNAYGGKSYGEEVRIIVLHSNHQAHAGVSILINTIKGEDNKFIICANAAPKKEAKYQAFIVGKEQFSKQLAEKQRRYTEELNELKRLQSFVQQIKEDIKHTNFKNTKLIKEQAQNYRNLVQFIQKLKEEIDLLAEKLEKINNEIIKFEENIGDSYVCAKGGWQGYNEVRFKKLFEDREIILNPQANRDHAKIMLDDTGNLLVSSRYVE